MKKNIKNKNQSNPVSNEKIDDIQLSSKEIDILLSEIEIVSNSINEIYTYKSACPEYLGGNCDGFDTDGCKSCKNAEIYDKNNGLPKENTIERKQYNKEIKDIVSNFYKTCSLKFNRKYCKYKNAFQFCTYCNCHFKRER